MERKSYHRFHLVELDGYDRVIVCAFLRLQLPVALRTLVDLIVFLYLIIGCPDGREAGRLSRHYVDAASEIVRQILKSRSCKFKYFVLYQPPAERLLNESDGYVMRSYAFFRLACHIAEDHFRRSDVPGVLQELLDELRSALADSHGSESSVACVAVRAEYHVAACSQLLPCVGVYDTLIRRNIYSSVFLCGREAEYVIVFIDSASDSAQAVVAVCHGIRNRELLKAACSGRLDDTNVRDIVRDQRIKTDMEYTVIRLGAVRVQDLISNSAVSSGVSVSILCRFLRSTIMPFGTLLIILDHCFLPFLKQ